MTLSTDFKDDILNESVNTKRKYNVIHNNDGTESYEDVTSYSQTGSQYGAKEVIEEREAINQLQKDVSSLNSALPVEQIKDDTGRSAIKFANGTMIQKRRLVIDDSGAFSAWGSSGLYYLRYGLGTYLEEFSDFPAVVVGVENAANILVGNVVSATRQRPGEIVLTKINSDSVAITLNYIAIGRWK